MQLDVMTESLKTVYEEIKIVFMHRKTAHRFDRRPQM